MRKRNAALGAGALLVAMFGGCAVGANNASTNTAQPPTPTKTIRVTTPGPTVTKTVAAKAATSQPKTTPSSATIPGDSGTLRVGKDVQPGTYVTKGNGENSFCTWTRNGPDGQPADVGVVTGQAVVTIQPSDLTFETNGCHDWKRE